MGLSPFSSSQYDHLHTQSTPDKSKKVLPNPNPSNYHIKTMMSIGKYMVILINYPDCTNYEGNKILVYKNVTLEDLNKQGSIDPHFSNNKSKHSPVARFEPTEYGWNLAVSFCKWAVKQI